MNRMLERMSHVLLAAAVLAVLSLTSCEHKDLCYDHYHNTKIQVVFDWKNAPDATPETMRLYSITVEVMSTYLPVVTRRCASTPTRSPCFTGTPTRSTALRPMPPKVS